MQKLLSPRFRTKYLEPGKVDTFIDLMSSFTFSTAPAPTTRHGFSGTRPGQSNTGFTGSSLTGLPGCGRAFGRVARVAFLPQNCKSCETKSSALPGNWDTTKTSGMVCSCLTTLRRTTQYLESVRQCQRLFHQLGFSLQRPRRQASEANPALQEAFKKTSTNG